MNEKNNIDYSYLRFFNEEFINKRFVLTVSYVINDGKFVFKKTYIKCTDEKLETSYNNIALMLQKNYEKENKIDISKLNQCLDDLSNAIYASIKAYENVPRPKIEFTIITKSRSNRSSKKKSSVRKALIPSAQQLIFNDSVHPLFKKVNPNTKTTDSKSLDKPNIQVEYRENSYL